MKLRWPISPRDESLVSSLLSDLAPPLRPATHSSFSFSRLSSNNRAMLTCAMGLPVGDQLVHLCSGGRSPHPLAEWLVAEHLRQLGEYLQVHVGGAVRHQQHEDELHRLAIGRVERDRLLRAHERAQCLLQALYPAVGNGDAAAEPGGPELLPREQAVENQAARDLVVVLEEEPHLLEQALLAADLEVQHHVGEREQLCDEAHVMEDAEVRWPQGTRQRAPRFLSAAPSWRCSRNL